MVIIFKYHKISRTIGLIFFLLFVLNVRYLSGFYLVFMMLFFIELLIKWKIKDFYIYSCLILISFSVGLSFFKEVQYVNLYEGLSLFIFGILVICVFLYRFSQVHFHRFQKIFKSKNDLISGILFPPYFLRIYKKNHENRS